MTSDAFHFNPQRQLSFRVVPGHPRHFDGDKASRVLFAAWRIELRQDRVLADAGRARKPLQGRDFHRRATHVGRAAASLARQQGVSKLCHLPPSEVRDNIAYGLRKQTAITGRTNRGPGNTSGSRFDPAIQGRDHICLRYPRPGRDADALESNSREVASFIDNVNFSRHHAAQRIGRGGRSRHCPARRRRHRKARRSTCPDRPAAGKFRLSARKPAADDAVAVRLDTSTYLGERRHYYVTLDGKPDALRSRHPTPVAWAEAPLAPDRRLWLS